MAGDPKIIAIYRMAEHANKYKDKVKLEAVNNQNCLLNFTENFFDTIIVFGDRLESQTIEEIRDILLEDDYIFHEVKNHGNAASFREAYEHAIANDPEDIVYFVEDDYIHRPGFAEIIKEGLERVNFVSLYDHPDKYTYEPTPQLFYTKSTHWKLTNSTTMTFAAKVKTLQEEQVKEIFWKYTDKAHPHDYYIFNELKEVGKTLATPIPGYATHGETQWLAPVIDWEEYI